jgi:histidine ammonia-lyase
MPTLSSLPGLVLSESDLSLNDIVAVARHHRLVSLSDSPGFRRSIERGRATLEIKLAGGEVIYGVNTGFGGNARFVIPNEELARHQRNLLEFLCCGVGEPLPEEAVRAAMLLRARALGRGLSAVRWRVIETLVELLNHDITPVVPRYGSVGASGDLCPSAYIARAMAGKGEVFYRVGRCPAAEALAQEGIAPLALEAKEGLALLNGTTVMTGIAALALEESAYLFRCAVAAIAMCVEIGRAHV